MAYNSSTANIKGCNYRCLGYPESMAKDTIDRLKNMGLLAFAVSTLHDKDRFTSDEFDDDGKLVHRAGDLKKAHYHFFLKFSGGTTWKTVYERICKPLGLVLSPKPDECLAFSEATALRYFLHLDNPEKYQYSIDCLDTCLFFGYSDKKLEEIFLSNSARVSYFLDIKKLVCAYDILFYNKLVDYLEACKAYDLIDYVIVSGRSSCREYIKDRCLYIYGDFKPSLEQIQGYREAHSIPDLDEAIAELSENK